MRENQIDTFYEILWVFLTLLSDRHTLIDLHSFISYKTTRKAKQLEKYSFASAVENSAKSPRGSKDTSRGGGGKSSDSILEIGTTATGTTSDEILDAFEGCSIKNSTASVSQSVVMYEKSFRSNLKSIPAV